MNIPAELKYSKSHEWVKELEDGSVLVGISDYAQDALGDLVFITLPVVGDATTAEESFCDVESIKAVSDVICPVSGTIAEVNEGLADEPEKLNSEPYEAWIAKIENITDKGELLSADEYAAFLETCEEA